MPHELDLHSLAEELARPDGAPPLDTAILAATAALSSAPESAGGQSAVAEALRCVVRIAERDAAGRVGPELIGLVVDRGKEVIWSTTVQVHSQVHSGLCDDACRVPAELKNRWLKGGRTCGSSRRDERQEPSQSAGPAHVEDSICSRHPLM